MAKGELLSSVFWSERRPLWQILCSIKWKVGRHKAGSPVRLRVLCHFLREVQLLVLGLWLPQTSAFLGKRTSECGHSNLSQSHSFPTQSVCHHQWKVVQDSRLYFVISRSCSFSLCPSSLGQFRSRVTLMVRRGFCEQVRRRQRRKSLLWCLCCLCLNKCAASAHAGKRNAKTFARARNTVKFRK